MIPLQTFQKRHFLQGELQWKELQGQVRGQQTGRGQSLLTSPLLQEKAKPVGPGKGREEQVKATALLDPMDWGVLTAAGSKSFA